MGIRVQRHTGDDGQVRWFEPPRLLTLTQQEDRHASWLELFFDLVFVVSIAELSHLRRRGAARPRASYGRLPSTRRSR